MINEGSLQLPDHRSIASFGSALIVFVLTVLAGGNLLNDPDSFWHVAVGSWILDNGPPRSDPFSWTRHGEHWISHEWLAQVAFAGAYDLAGWTAVVALTAASIALAVGLLAWRLSADLRLPAVTVAVGIVFVLVAPHMIARPHVLALPVLTAWAAALARAADAGRVPSWWLLLLMILWANLHGGFTFGLALAALVALDAVAGAPHAERRRIALGWARFVAASLLAACVTPYGPESLLTTVRVLGLGDALRLIVEWRPPDFSEPTVFELVLLGALAAVLITGLRLRVTRVVLLVILIHLALSAVRNAELLALVAPLFLARPIAEQRSTLASSAPETQPRSALAPAVVSVVVAVAAVVGAGSVQSYAPGPAIAPAAALERIADETPGAVLNDYRFGGFMIFTGRCTFIDGRTELYGSDFFLRYVRAVELRDLADLDAILDEYRIGATLLAPSTPAVQYLDRQPGWRRVHSDGASVAHVRAGAAIDQSVGFVCRPNG